MENNEQKQSKVVVIPEIILQDKRFNPATKLVYARISFFDEFWESSEKTAEYLGLKKYTVQEAKRTLEHYGAIIETQNTGRGKRYMTCSKIGELLLEKDLSEDNRRRLEKLSEVCKARANHEPRKKVKTSGETNSDVKMEESLEIPNSELAYDELRVRESLDIGKKEVRKREDISLSKDKGKQASEQLQLVGLRAIKVGNKLKVVDKNGEVQGGNPYTEKAYMVWKEIMGFSLKRDKWNSQAGYNMMRAKDKGEDWLKGMLRACLEAKKDPKADWRVSRISNLADLQKNQDVVIDWVRQKTLKSNSNAVFL